MRAAGIFFAITVVVTTMIWFVWWQIRRRGSRPQRNFYPSVDFDDDEEDARELDSNIVGSTRSGDMLEDDEPDAQELSSNFGARSANLNLDDDSFDPRDDNKPFSL